MTEVLRVFPRRTKATPLDPGAHVGYPDLFSTDVDEIHISVAFTWDLPEAERLAEVWKFYGKVKIGGPGTGMRGNGFISGRYLKDGITITSRGCPNKCWFCKVHERETFQELPVVAGSVIQDDNLFACSEQHIRAVFTMLERYPKKAIELRGLEAKLLQPWHVELLRDLNPSQVFFAYDTPADYEPLLAAAELLKQGEWSNFRKTRCYNLIGYEGDTIHAAERRLRNTVIAGFLPFAMLYHDDEGRTQGGEWKKFHRTWCRPAAIITVMKEHCRALLASWELL